MGNARDSGLPEGRDPTMEEILSSIRRIIADDDKEAAESSEPAEPSAELPPQEPEPFEAAKSEVLELAEPAAPPSAAAPEIQKTSGTGTDLEAMVRELLRPMLKAWIDANLPDIVNEMVAKEIARITRK